MFSANTSDTRLDRDALIEAITQKPFIIYSIVYIVGVFVLTGLSASRHGRDWVFVDVGLCALFGTWHIVRVLECHFSSRVGGFTVLSTKALSTLLTMEWIKIFTEWITYPIIAVSSVYHSYPISLPYTPSLLDPPRHWYRPNKILESCADEV